nr:hypothetical protein BaRGS_003907 [Batillaria attramentaria]
MCIVGDVGTEVVLDQAAKDAIVQKHNDLREGVNPLAGDMTKMICSCVEYYCCCCYYFYYYCYYYYFYYYCYYYYFYYYYYYYYFYYYCYYYYFYYYYY